jgi:hypothetical protein
VTASDPWGDRVPKNGDYAMCKFCGDWSVFTARGTKLRKANVTERAAMAKHPGVNTLKSIWSKTRH